MTKDEALKLALEALEEAHHKMEHYQDEKKREQAITAIKQALAAPVQEPVAWEQFYPDIGKPKLAYLPPTKSPENACYTTPPAAPVQGFVWDASAPLVMTTHPAFATPHAAQRQPCPTCEALARAVMMDQTAHDTQRQWVGLTGAEVSNIIDDVIGFNSCWGPETDFARAIEAKLKEKNT